MSSNVLIIDDNRMNLDVLAMMLEQEGIAHVAIDSPRYLESALEQVGSVDVVFLDLEMPNHDGFDVIKSLQGDNRFQHTKIVACTVHTNVVDKARKAGFHGFIGKPLDTRRFPGQLKRILNNESVWEA